MFWSVPHIIQTKRPERPKKFPIVYYVEENNSGISELPVETKAITAKWHWCWDQYTNHITGCSMNTEASKRWAMIAPALLVEFATLTVFIYHHFSLPLVFSVDSTTTDSRVEHLPFLGSPIPIIVLIVSYVYSVTIWGPNFMKPRKAYDLKGVIKIYNLIQIFTNLYIGIVVSGLFIINFIRFILLLFLHYVVRTTTVENHIRVLKKQKNKKKKTIAWMHAYV